MAHLPICVHRCSSVVATFLGARFHAGQAGRAALLWSKDEHHAKTKTGFRNAPAAFTLEFNFRCISVAAMLGTVSSYPDQQDQSVSGQPKKPEAMKNSACSVSSATRSMLSMALVFFLVAAFLPATHGGTKFWTGSNNGNFNNAGNWSPSGAPAAGDDLVFQPPPVTRLLVTNDFSPNRGFNSITFQGSNYFVRGNALLLTNGITALNLTGANHIDADVDVRASQPWEATGPTASLDVNGDINLRANTLTVRANTGDFFFSGIISGTGGINKTNVGTLRMDGSGHNTYTGTTIFGGGVLELDKFSIFPSFTNFTSIPRSEERRVGKECRSR